MHGALMQFVKDEEGTTVVEWALVVGLISIAAILLFPQIGTKITAIYQKILDALA